MIPTVVHYAMERAVTVVGSLLAILGGIVAATTPPDADGNSRAIAIAGIIAALGGLVTAIGAIVIPALKIWSDNKIRDREMQVDERKAKLARHDLADKIQANMAEIELLKHDLAQARAAAAEAKAHAGEANARLDERVAGVERAQAEPPPEV